MMDPARVLTVTDRVHAARSIADDTRKTDTTLTLGGRRFVYIRLRSIVTHEQHLLSYLLYGIVRVVRVVIYVVSKPLGKDCQIGCDS